MVLYSNNDIILNALYDLLVDIFIEMEETNDESDECSLSEMQ
jgi:hypothetical protein